MKKTLMLGNEAVARGLYEAGVTVVSSYPGTPSTEITENVVQYGDDVYCEWAPNEKVAFEVAFGASTGGARSFCAMKHVGLNVAADPLYTASYIGVNAGMVCAVADDPGMHSSQNEQDSRHHAIAAKVPMLEPSDSAECLAFTKLAYELSEQFDTPVLLRLSTRISHSRSLVELSPREERPLKEYHKDVMKNVMMPAMARGAHVKVEKRTEALRRWAETASINTVEYNDKRIGIICAGTTYTYAKEALGERASFLKLGMVNPLPVSLIVEFARNVGQVYVIEELDDIIETHCRKHGIPVIGNNQHVVTVSTRSCHGLPNTLIHGSHGLPDGLVHSGMSHHIPVRVIQANEINTLFIQLLHDLLGHDRGRHFGLQIVGCHFRRRYQNTALSLERLFPSPVQEERHVSIFLRLGNTQLFQSLLGNIFPDRVHHVFFIEQNM